MTEKSRYGNSSVLKEFIAALVRFCKLTLSVSVFKTQASVGSSFSRQLTQVFETVVPPWSRNLSLE